MYINSIKHMAFYLTSVQNSQWLYSCRPPNIVGGGAGVGWGKGRDMSVACALFDSQKIQLKTE